LSFVELGPIVRELSLVALEPIAVVRECHGAFAASRYS